MTTPFSILIRIAALYIDEVAMRRSLPDEIHNQLFHELNKANCFDITCFIRIDQLKIMHCTYQYDENDQQTDGFCEMDIQATAYSVFDNYTVRIYHHTKNKKTSDLIQYYLKPGAVCMVSGSLSVNPGEEPVVSIYGPRFSPIDKTLYPQAKQWFVKA